MQVFRHLLISNFGRWLGRNVGALLLPFWRLSKRQRVRTVIVGADNKVLLVRNWLGNQNWTLPGGGVKKGEAPNQAAVREILEEVGIDLSPESWKFLVDTEIDESSGPFAVKIGVISMPKSDKRRVSLNNEIVEAGWFDYDNLPDRIAMRRGLLKYSSLSITFFGAKPYYSRSK